MGFKVFFACVFLMAFCSCKKVDLPLSSKVSSLKKGLLVLNEGLFNLNNASLSWIDLQTNAVETDFFVRKTGRFLGDTGNDLGTYGSKIYIVVNVSSTIEVLDALTGNSIKQISMLLDGKSKQPRNMVFYEGKVFISCFDGYVDVLDTSSLLIEKRIKVGSNPDNLTIVNDEIWIANSGGLKFPMYDSTISIIHPKSFKVVKELVVGKNPGGISQIGSHVIVHTRGDYGECKPQLHRIEPISRVIEKSQLTDVSYLQGVGDTLLCFSSNRISVLSIKTLTLEKTSFISLNEVISFYGIQYLPMSKSYLVFDANGYTNLGYVYTYSETGQKIRKYNVGLNPSRAIEF